MYVNENNTNTSDVISFINGSDIYNSKLLTKIKELDPEKHISFHSLDKSDRRIDILCKKIYENQSSSMESFLSLMNPDFKNTAKQVKYIRDLGNAMEDMGL